MNETSLFYKLWLHNSIYILQPTVVFAFTVWFPFLQTASYNVSTDKQIGLENEHVAEVRKGDQLPKNQGC